MKNNAEMRTMPDTIWKTCTSFLSHMHAHTAQVRLFSKRIHARELSMLNMSNGIAGREYIPARESGEPTCSARLKTETPTPLLHQRHSFPHLQA